MKRLSLLLGIAGLALATALVVGRGVGEVAGHLAAAGPALILVALARFVPLWLSAIGWRVLAPGAKRRSTLWFTWAVWVREAVNALLPVLRIGGEVVSVRMLAATGVSTAMAAAGLVVDITLSLLILTLFVASGLVVLALGGGGDTSLLINLTIGLVVSGAVIVAFAAVQRAGLFGLAGKLLSFAGGDLHAVVAGGAARLDRATRRLWSRRDRVLRSLFWQSLSWLSGVGEMWVTLAVLGVDAGLREAFVLEALVLGVGNAAFVVPGALGVQEGGFLVIGAALGLSPEIAMAAALVRRSRDIVVYSPALILWASSEGRGLFRRLREPARPLTEPSPTDR